MSSSNTVVLVLIAVLSSIPQLRRSICQGRNIQVLYPGSKYQTLHPANVEKHLLKKKYQVLQPSTKYHVKYFIPRKGEYLTRKKHQVLHPISKYQITSTKYFISRWGRSTYQLPRTPSSGGSQVQGSLSCSHGSVFDPPSHFSYPHPCL